MKLVEDWKNAWKWFSVHVATVMAVINGLQASVPYIQGLVTPTQLGWINAVLGLMVIWARLVAQL